MAFVKFLKTIQIDKSRLNVLRNALYTFKIYSSAFNESIVRSTVIHFSRLFYILISEQIVKNLLDSTTMLICFYVVNFLGRKSI